MFCPLAGGLSCGTWKLCTLQTECVTASIIALLLFKQLALKAYQYLALRITPNFLYSQVTALFLQGTRNGKMIRVKLNSNDRRKKFGCYAIVFLAILSVVGLVIGFFTGKSAGEDASKSPNQTTCTVMPDKRLLHSLTRAVSYNS